MKKNVWTIVAVGVLSSVFALEATAQPVINHNDSITGPGTLSVRITGAPAGGNVSVCVHDQDDKSTIKGSAQARANAQGTAVIKVTLPAGNLAVGDVFTVTAANGTVQGEVVIVGGGRGMPTMDHPCTGPCTECDAPTMTTWGVIVMGTLLTACAGVVLKRRLGECPNA